MVFFFLLLPSGYNDHILVMKISSMLGIPELVPEAPRLRWVFLGCCLPYILPQGTCPGEQHADDASQTIALFLHILLTIWLGTGSERWYILICSYAKSQCLCLQLWELMERINKVRIHIPWSTLSFTKRGDVQDITFRNCLVAANGKKQHFALKKNNTSQPLHYVQHTI